MEEQHEYRLLTCPCGQKMKVRADAKATAYKCPKCGEKILLEPAPATAPSGESRDKIGQMLIDGGLITPEQLNEVLEAQRTEGGKTFELLIRKGYLEKESLHKFLSQQPGIATIELSRFQIDRNLTALIPREIALGSLVLPIDKLSKLLTVAMACPLDLETIAQMEKATGLKVKALLCRLDDIHAAVQKYYPLDRGQGKVEDYRLLPKKAVLSQQDVEKKIATFEFLPIGPGTATMLAGLGGNGKSLKPFVIEIMEDPCLTANVIAAANAKLYGAPREVSTPAAAAILLGGQGLKALAQGMQVDDQLISQWLRRRATQRAKFTYILAKRGGAAGPNLAATGGLLFELGRFAIAQLAPDAYQPFKEFTEEAVKFAESKKVPMSHFSVGIMLARQWNFPQELCEIFGGNAGEGETALQALLRISNTLVEHQMANSGAPLKLNPQQLAAIHLADHEVFEAINEAQAQSRNT